MNITTSTAVKRDPALIASLCKDIARHASQLEAEIAGAEQSAERYSELKNLLTNYYLQGGDDFEVILKEMRNSMRNACNNDNEDKKTAASIKNHVLCILEYFLMLTNEASKD